jgi:hypothetical protein
VRFVVADPVVPPEGRDGAVVERATVQRSSAVDLAERGLGYRWLVSTRAGGDQRVPSLTGRGSEMLRRLDEARVDPSGMKWRTRRVAWWAWYAAERRRERAAHRSDGRGGSDGDVESPSG